MWPCDVDSLCRPEANEQHSNESTSANIPIWHVISTILGYVARWDFIFSNLWEPIKEQRECQLRTKVFGARWVNYCWERLWRASEQWVKWKIQVDSCCYSLHVCMYPLSPGFLQVFTRAVKLWQIFPCHVCTYLLLSRLSLHAYIQLITNFF